MMMMMMMMTEKTIKTLVKPVYDDIERGFIRQNVQLWNKTDVLNVASFNYSLYMYCCTTTLFFVHFTTYGNVSVVFVIFP